MARQWYSASVVATSWQVATARHGIILLFLPPNMTAWLQPLDLVVCGLIKTLQRARRGWHLARNLQAWKDPSSDEGGDPREGGGVGEMQGKGTAEVLTTPPR